LDSPAQPKRTEGSIAGGVSFRAARVASNQSGICSRRKGELAFVVRGSLVVGVLSDELLGKIDRGLILHLELEDYV